MDTKSTTLAFSALVSILVNTVSPFIIGLLVVMTCDYVTGVAKAVMNGEYRSGTAVRGIFKKLCYLFLVVGGMGVDVALYYYSLSGMGVQPSFYVTTTLSVWLLINDFLSVIYNMEGMGVKLPKSIKRLLMRGKENLDDDDSPKE